MTRIDPVLRAALQRGGFFAETHSIKAWQAIRFLRTRHPDLSAIFDDAPSWNQVLQAPAVSGLLSAHVEFPIRDVSDRMLAGHVDEAVFPIAYLSATEWTRRHTFRSLVAARNDRALLRIGNLGHAFTVQASFLELCEDLERSGDDTGDAVLVASERYAEFVASQLGTVDFARPDADFDALLPEPEVQAILVAALERPGYFGHALITAGVLLRLEPSLDTTRRRFAWHALAKMIPSGRPLHDVLDVREDDGDVKAAVASLLREGPREAHTLTLARALHEIADVHEHLAPHLCAVARVFSRLAMKRTVAGRSID